MAGSRKYTNSINSKMSALAFGLIGYGAWGKHHARAIRETAGAELRAICVQSEGSRAAAAETGANVYADYRDMLAQGDLDVIDIVLPNHLHEEVACAALELVQAGLVVRRFGALEPGGAARVRACQQQRHGGASAPATWGEAD